MGQGERPTVRGSQVVACAGSPVGSSRAPYSDVGILMVSGQVEHVVQGQHAWRGLEEVQGGVGGALWKQEGLSRPLAWQPHRPGSPPCTPPTDREAQHLVVLGVDGLALLRSAARDAAALGLECDPAQLKEDVPLGLRGTRGTVSLGSGGSRTPTLKAAGGYPAHHLVVGVHFGHHPLLPEVESQDLQHVQLVGHLGFDRAVPSDDVLGGGA